MVEEALVEEELVTASTFYLLGALATAVVKRRQPTSSRKQPLPYRRNRRMPNQWNHHGDPQHQCRLVPNQ